MPPKHEMTVAELQRLVSETFRVFGVTPLGERVKDIIGEANELGRHTSVANLREEAGDLLASILQFCNECDWNAEELIVENAAKINRRKAQYRTLGRKVRVAIFGGSFDPVHNGHIAAAKLILDASKYFDEVWLMPAYRHMDGKKLQSARHRLAMCRLAAQVDARIRVFGYEIEHKLAGATYYFAKRLMAEDFAKDKYEFSFVLGLDVANRSDEWDSFDQLEKMMKFVVVSRAGNPLVIDSWYINHPHRIIVDDRDLIPDISSTRVRRMIAVGDPAVIQNLDPQVLAYIEKRGLYRRVD